MPEIFRQFVKSDDESLTDCLKVTKIIEVLQTS